MMKAARNLKRYEFLLPLLLGVVFFVITVPGTSWGVPGHWHPDELVRRVSSALAGTWEFDTVNFDYPSLPKYAMYGLGKLVLGRGYSQAEFLIAARMLSVLLGSFTVILAYWNMRLLGGGVPAACLAALLLLVNSEMAVNFRWAHNDPYITFFVSLTVFFMLRYNRKLKLRWLYLSFLGVGLAASSKYNAGSLIIAPVLLYLLVEWQGIWKKIGQISQTLFLGLIFSALGYITGTPKAALWLAFYLKRLIPALQHHAIYGRGPDSIPGALGQWSVLYRLFGGLLFIWMLAAVLYTLFILGEQLFRRRILMQEQRGWLIVVLAIAAIDLPIMVSYNYQSRFFLPMVALLVLMAAHLAEQIWQSLLERKRVLRIGFMVIVSVILLLGAGRVFAVYLLFENDARIPAGLYIQQLPAGEQSIEYTLYPPTIEHQDFIRAHNYPLTFIKYAGQILPTSPYFEFNRGEIGIEGRATDYLVIDSFTYQRFDDPFICGLHQAECDFFTRLQAGETDYQLMATFSYALPAWLPEPAVSFLNPTIQIYQRVAP